MSLSAPQEIAINGAPFSVGIVAARFNPELVEALLERVTAGLAAAGVKAGRVTVVRGGPVARFGRQT
jgi:6,7-dimethyl-8-ribityllumazine synthase